MLSFENNSSDLLKVLFKHCNLKLFSQKSLNFTYNFFYNNNYII